MTEASPSAQALATTTGSDLSMKSLLLEKTVETGSGVFLRAAFAGPCSAFRVEIIAIIGALFVPDPFRLILVAFIVSVGIVVPAIQAAVQVRITFHAHRFARYAVFYIIRSAALKTDTRFGRQ